MNPLVPSNLSPRFQASGLTTGNGHNFRNVKCSFESPGDFSQTAVAGVPPQPYEAKFPKGGLGHGSWGCVS